MSKLATDPTLIQRPRRASHEEVINSRAFEQLAAEAGLDVQKRPQKLVRRPESEIDIERLRRDAAPSPLALDWSLRAGIVASLTLAIPLVARLVGTPPTAEHESPFAIAGHHVAVHAPRVSPNASTHPAVVHVPPHHENAFVAAHGAHEEHGGDHGGHHGDTSVLDLWWTLAIVLVLIGLTIAFEKGREELEGVMRRYELVLERIWSELTVLGFLALVTFLLTQSSALPALSSLAYGDDEHLIHLFESIHFSLFFVLVGFLFGALWLLWAAGAAGQLWESFEVFIRCFGQQPLSAADRDRAAASRASADGGVAQPTSPQPVPAPPPLSPPALAGAETSPTPQQQQHGGSGGGGGREGVGTDGGKGGGGRGGTGGKGGGGKVHDFGLQLCATELLLAERRYVRHTSAQCSCSLGGCAA